MGLAGPGGTPIPTPRGAATQMPPSAAPPKTVVVAAHTRTAPGTKAKPAAASSSGLGATLPGVDQEALARAQMAVTPSVQAAQAAQAQDAANTAAQAKLLAGYYGALVPLEAQIAPGVQAGYQQAASTDALLGSAFGGQLNQQDAANAAQAASVLQSQGAPAGQIQAATNATGSPGLGDALGWLNAGLPAQGLAQAGAAYGAAARMLPASIAGIGGQELAQNAAVGANQQTTEQQKIANAVARIPGLVNTYAPSIERSDLSALSAQSLANYRIVQAKAAQEKINLSAQVDQARIAYDNGLLTQKQYQNRVTAAKDQAAQVDAAAKIAIEQQNANTSQYRATHPTSHDTPNVTLSRSTGFVSWIDSNGVVHHATDPNGNPIPYKSATSSSTKAKAANGGLTTNELSNVVKSYANGTTRDVRVPATDANGNIIRNASGVEQFTTQTQTTGQRTFNEAITGLVGLGVNRAKAMNAVLSNPTYFQQAQTAATQVAQAYAQKGTPKATALREIRATGVLPNSLITPALNTAYTAAAKAAKAKRGAHVGPTGSLGVQATAPGIG